MKKANHKTCLEMSGHDSKLWIWLVKVNLHPNYFDEKCVRHVALTFNRQQSQQFFNSFL